MTLDEKYMQRCFELALKGQGNVSPNPMVGCVIVCDNEIIGEGYHQVYGEAHAEVNAINAVKDKSLLSKSTLYVNLEPCAHYGKTPPCANLIIEHNIPNVIIGCVDSFSEVAGKGIEKLKAAECNVDAGILEQEALHLNRRFFTFHNKQRPYIILKWAQSKDGFIDKQRTSNETGVNWITHQHTKKTTHLWRAQEDAILVGKNTVLNDNPSLTVRATDGNNPIRIVLGKESDFSPSLNIFSNEAETLFFSDDISSVLTSLHQQNIQSVIIEGGKHVLEQFIEHNLWDEARVLTGDVYFTNGLSAPKLKHSAQKSETIGIDTIDYYFNA